MGGVGPGGEEWKEGREGMGRREERGEGGEKRGGVGGKKRDERERGMDGGGGKGKEKSPWERRRGNGEKIIKRVDNYELLLIILTIHVFTFERFIHGNLDRKVIQRMNCNSPNSLPYCKRQAPSARSLRSLSPVEKSWLRH